jgi:hypothetical protein
LFTDLVKVNTLRSVSDFFGIVAEAQLMYTAVMNFEAHPATSSPTTPAAGKTLWSQGIQASW